MKCFAVKLKQETNIEGVLFPANDKPIAVLTTEVSPTVLLGLIQYHHAALEEIHDLPDEGDGDGEDAGQLDGQSGDSQDSEANETTGAPHFAETVTAPPAGATQPVAGGDESARDGDGQPATPLDEFIAAGLDQKTAEALMRNGIGSIAELSEMLADPEFDLAELEDIGPVRIEKIKAIFLVDQK